MDATRKLESPIELPLPYRKIRPGDIKFGQAAKVRAPSDPFIKYGHPFRSLDRFFVGLEPIRGGVNAIDFTQGSPVGYVKKLSVVADVREDRLCETCHPNLVNLREVFISTGAVFFVYEKGGLSLEDILELSEIFHLGEVEVATICQEVLQGLRYVHNVLGISHGSLTPGNIHIMEDGNVKIANIGESMVGKPAGREKSQDIQAVCSIARTLLSQKTAPERRGTVGILASDFFNVPPTATIDELLQHSFMRIGAGAWCLRPVNVLCTVAQKFKSPSAQST
ncbi:kinase-like domain-containing protein [Aspergillus varians]